MTLPLFVRRLLVNLAGIFGGLLVASLLFDLLKGHERLAVPLAVLAAAAVFALVDVVLARLDRGRRPFGIQVVEREARRYLKVYTLDGRTSEVQLDDQAIAEFRQLAARVMGGALHADVMAFTMQLATTEATPARGESLDGLDADLETARAAIRALTVDAEAMAGDYRNGFVLSFVRHSSKVDDGAHALARAAYQIHRRAIQARADLFLQNRDR